MSNTTPPPAGVPRPVPATSVAAPHTPIKSEDAFYILQDAYLGANERLMHLKDARTCFADEYHRDGYVVRISVIRRPVKTRREVIDRIP